MERKAGTSSFYIISSDEEDIGLEKHSQKNLEIVEEEISCHETKEEYDVEKTVGCKANYDNCRESSSRNLYHVRQVSFSKLCFFLSCPSFMLLPVFFISVAGLGTTKDMNLGTILKHFSNVFSLLFLGEKKEIIT